jgi:peptidoglycan/LPS O-acetylase OafA/YrhL
MNAAAVEGGSLLATLFCWSAIILLVVCAVLEFTRRRVIGTWLLVLFPAAMCASLLLDLAHGATKLGRAAYNSDLRTLPFLFGFLALAILAALRPGWRWLFWIEWIIGAVLCSIAVYLTFFWHVFS